MVLQLCPHDLEITILYRSTFAVTIFSTVLFGQFNLQFHYDLGRGIYTSTAELFYPDEYGFTFGFSDINFDTKHYKKEGATDVYFEIARYLYTPLLNRRLSFTIQYNDGVIFKPGTDSTLFSTISPTWLTGISYNFPREKGYISTDILARSDKYKKEITPQFTLVWFYSIMKQLHFLGYLDVWNVTKGGTTTLLAEPQFLYQHKKLACGIELEISRGFPGAWTQNEEYFNSEGNPQSDKFWLIPTLFIRYTF